MGGRYVLCVQRLSNRDYRRESSLSALHPRLQPVFAPDLLNVVSFHRQARARELLARHMPLVLTPDGRAYRVTGGFNLALCLDDDHDPAASPAESLIMPVGGTGIEPATRAV
jgi:hypothetical protein